MLRGHVASSAVFAANIVFNREAGYFDNLSETKPLLHLWSLCVEEQFYILWPILLFLAGRLRRNFYPFVLVLVFLLSFLSNVVYTRSDPSAAFFLASNRFWELTAGGLLAWSCQRSLHANTRVGGLGPSHASCSFCFAQ